MGVGGRARSNVCVCVGGGGGGGMCHTLPPRRFPRPCVFLGVSVIIHCIGIYAFSTVFHPTFLFSFEVLCGMFVLGIFWFAYLFKT